MKTQKLWCCVDTNFNNPLYYLPSLSHRKKDSILATVNSILTWDDLQAMGWKCIKVEVIIKPLNEVK